MPTTSAVAEALERFLENGELPEEFVVALAKALGRRCFACHSQGQVVDTVKKDIGERPTTVIYLRCPWDGHGWEQYEPDVL